MAEAQGAALRSLRSCHSPSLAARIPQNSFCIRHTGPVRQISSQLARPRRKTTSYPSSPPFQQPPLRRRTYYSPSDPIPPASPEPQATILASALSHVPTHGFTVAAIQQALKDHGYPPVSANLFPRGAYDLVHYHLVSQRLGLKERVRFPAAEDGAREPGEKSSPEGLSVDEKTKRLMWARLLGNEAIVSRLQEVRLRYPMHCPRAVFADAASQAIALLTVPPNLPASLRELALLSDEILHLAGHAAVDGTWYTSRAAISSIYAASELFMTTDTSKGFAETERFLDRRLEERGKIRGAVGDVGEWVNMQGRSLVNVLRSKGMWI
jgi:ubiquinone biosynthesis protein COQ9